MRYLSICFCFFLALASCGGYRWGTGAPLRPYTTVSIPPVVNDFEGLLTEHLVEEMEAIGIAHYVPCDGTFTLKVTLEDEKADFIGFRYAEEDQQLIHRTVSSEGRLTVTARVELINAQTKRRVFGPTCVTEQVCYDFEPEANEQSPTGFSLGQLNAEGLAKESARRSLYALLAKKIIIYIDLLG